MYAPFRTCNMQKLCEVHQNELNKINNKMIKVVVIEKRLRSLKQNKVFKRFLYIRKVETEILLLKTV